MSVTLKHFYKFDPFVLDVEERVLLRNGRPVAVTPKVFDTLLLLVQNHGSVVSKQKILDTLWPDVFVEETYETLNITMLRKAPGTRNATRSTSKPCRVVVTASRPKSEKFCREIFGGVARDWRILFLNGWSGRIEPGNSKSAPSAVGSSERVSQHKDEETQ
jgi:hypothetical protein